MATGGVMLLLWYFTLLLSFIIIFIIIVFFLHYIRLSSRLPIVFADYYASLERFID